MWWMKYILLLSFAKSGDVVIVQLSQGLLAGSVHKLVTGDGIYYSFKGIPYAAPPIGDLRFAPPRPPQTWVGVRPAKKHGNICYQVVRAGGSEDCLFLNVYTPPNLSPSILYPVMVFIHGGSFRFDSGNSDYLSPDFLVSHNVIVVTFNYRLEVLGFLSLQNEKVPGNNGLKDQVAALKWIKKHIQQFGGDNTNVTIFGASAGAVSVGYHMMSPMSKGLFNRAILMSGSPLSDWGFIENPRERAFNLGRSLGLYTENDTELLDFLRKVPKEKLADKRINGFITPWDTLTSGIKLGSFVPTVENVPGDGGRFLSETPNKYLDARVISSDIDVMIGFTSGEGIIIYPSFSKDYDIMNRFPEYFLTKRLAYLLPLKSRFEIGSRIRERYLNDTKAGPNTATDVALTKYYSWSAFYYDILDFLYRLPSGSIGKRYLYKFSAETERNYHKQWYGSNTSILPGVCHLDDMPYIFDAPALNMTYDKTLQSYNVIQWMSILWTNFAKTGKPTKNASLGVTWKPWTKKAEHLLQIDTNKLKLRLVKKHKDFVFWNSQYSVLGSE